MSFRGRRWLGCGVLALACLFSGLVYRAWTTHLRRADLGSGLLLLGLVLLLALFNARKKLPFLPLLRASTWLQVHIYAGLFSVWLFWLHTGGRVPRGGLESVLALLFLGVTASGFLGLALTRWIPVRLTIHGESLIFERLPALRAAVRLEVEELVAGSIKQTRSSTLADFYELRLQPYFARPSFFLSHAIGYRKPLFKLLSEVEALDRYLNASERTIMARITELIHAKDNLDFQFAGQSLLKGWLFVHIPLTYGLILFGLVHGILAWSFS